MNLVKLLTAESQKNIRIFTLLEKFYLLLNSENWIKNYIFWELELFKALGYDLQFKDLVDKKETGNKYQYVAKSSIQKKIIPNFLVEKTQSTEDLSLIHI